MQYIGIARRTWWFILIGASAIKIKDRFLCDLCVFAVSFLKINGFYYSPQRKQRLINIDKFMNLDYYFMNLLKITSKMVK